MLKFDDSFSNAKIAALHTQEEERSIQALAPQLGFEYINLQSTTIDPEALAAISEQSAKQALVVAFQRNRKVLSVAAKNPNSPATQAVLQQLQKQQYSVMLHICSQASLDFAWKRYNDIVASETEERGVFKIPTTQVVSLIAKIKEREDVAKQLLEIGTAGNAQKISETLALIFAGALALRASDIHIEPESEATRVRYRLDGVLHDIVDLDSYLYNRIMSRLKLLSGMTLNVKVEAQDGRFTFATNEREVEVRSSVIPGALGESIVMRLLDPSVSSFSLEHINLNPYIKAALLEQIKKPNGLIITTGPTGSGKTTALYAILREVHNEGKKIITIENPVEYKIDGIVHTQTDENYTFSSGLRAILRQDPDVILIGEIRDKEVAETALHAAQTGHLVFSTLHTNSAIAGFTRLIDLGVNPQVMGSAINMILGQRLVRLLCSACKQPYQATPAEDSFVRATLANHPYPPALPPTLTFQRAVGCEICGGTGFAGRTGVFEGIIMDDAVDEVVTRDPREHTIITAAKAQKIPTMLEDGLMRVITGETSLAELERVVEFPHQAPAPAPITQNPPAPSDDEFLSHVV